MSVKKVESKVVRQRFSAQFKQQALQRAAQDGVPTAARDLGLQPTQLYAWRAKAQQQGEDTQAQRLMQSQVAQLKRDVERLEQENAFLKKAAAYFAKQPK
jgi:transposase